MNTPDNWLTTAKIDNEDRRAFWLATLGTDIVPIVSIVPEWATLPRIGLTLVYMLDMEALSQEQQGKLLRGLAERFGMTTAEAQAEWPKGVPILADDVEVTTSDLALIACILDDDLEQDEMPDEDYPDVDDIWLEQMLGDDYDE